MSDYQERDSQRGKLYKAERLVERGREFGTVEAVEAYLTRCFAQKWFRKHYPEVRYFRVHDGRRRTKAGGSGHLTISGGRCELWLPRWSRFERVVLHELAHGMTDIHEEHERVSGAWWAPHGWQYAKIFLDLVRHFMGAAAGESLRTSFRAHRVRYYPPRKGRKMTPAQRAAACERLARARQDKERRDA